jgi:hypothetical protein
MPEEFLHFIWLYQLFNHSSLISTKGEPIQILSPGVHNHDSGPDFSDAKVIIDGTLWIGNIEIHVNASDWFSHQHQFDPAYLNVILHVVYVDDFKKEDIRLAHLPALQLKGSVDQSKFMQWERLKQSKGRIACDKFIENVPSIIKSQMITRSAIERLERKVEEVEVLLFKLKGHWDSALMQTLVTAMGSKVNTEAFRSLASLLPYEFIRKNEHKHSNIAAILFGIAGFLDGKFEDKYPQELQSNFFFLKKTHNFYTLNKSTWKFMRMRPSNFPSIRIAQLIEIFSKWTSFSENLFYQQDLHLIEECFTGKINDYWHCHLLFDKKTKQQSIKMGSSWVNNIIINGVVPFLYAYGKLHDESRLQQAALTILEQCKAESNRIINDWKKKNISAHNALESQGLIELKNNFCTVKKCLSCKIGIWIMNPK